jgi:hypothetical protein
MPSAGFDVILEELCTTRKMKRFSTQRLGAGVQPPASSPKNCVGWINTTGLSFIWPMRTSRASMQSNQGIYLWVNAADSGGSGIELYLKRRAHKASRSAYNYTAAVAGVVGERIFGGWQREGQEEGRSRSAQEWWDQNAEPKRTGMGMKIYMEETRGARDKEPSQHQKKATLTKLYLQSTHTVCTATPTPGTHGIGRWSIADGRCVRSGEKCK